MTDDDDKDKKKRVRERGFPKTLTYEQLRHLAEDQGLTSSQLARRWGVTVQAVDSRLYRARRAAGIPPATEVERQRNVPSRRRIEEALGARLEEFRDRCHEASLALVRSGLVQGRVARGWCRPWVTGQHSWVVLGDDPYSPVAWVLDVTLWAHGDFPMVYSRRNLEIHVPHGYGHWGTARRLPGYSGGPVIELDVELSPRAQDFIRGFSPRGVLDAPGWHALAHLPVLGWPAREIISAMLATPRLAALVPIDVAGMLTDRNPGRLYLRENAA